ncbi:MAG: tripartite tricarboxylate transporter substrate binding protein [Hyphomicrobiales bacterium]|nr:tripartite tricarboxylate transporter substrate binding protein [Hyphomicrobiales bacterium]
MPRPGLTTAALLGALALFVQSPPAAAQSGQSINLIVGFAAGGASDIIARLVAGKLGQALGGVNVVVDNRPGASGNLASRLVATSEANGLTVLVTTTSIAVNETLYKNRGYSAHDLRAVSIAAATPESLVINPNNPAKTLREFIANAKGKSINFGSAGAGTSSYISVDYFFRTLAKINAVHVPFQGGAPALNALMGGHIDAVGITLPTIVPHVAAGRLRGIAVASPKRLAAVPDLPTYQEAGFEGFVAFTWVGFFVPVKTSDAVAGRLNAAINDVLTDAETRQKLSGIGFEARPSPLDAANAEYKREIEHWGKMVTTLGLSAN